MLVRKMPLPFGLVSREIAAGPYLDKPEDMLGIKVAAELRERCVMHVSIKDFGVPLRPDQLLEALRFALDRLAEGMPLYVGCRGGQGRTGLFLAVLVKALGEDDPVDYVRECYSEKAVETFEQECYVENFDVTPLLPYVKAAKKKAFWHSLKRLFGWA